MTLPDHSHHRHYVLGFQTTFFFRFDLVSAHADRGFNPIRPLRPLRHSIRLKFHFEQQTLPLLNP